MTTTTMSALDELRRLEQAARDADAQVGLLQHEERQAITDAAVKRQAVHDFYAAVGAGKRDHDEAALKKLTSEANRAEQPIVERPTASEPERVVHLAFEGRIAEVKLRHNVAVSQLRSFALANREEVGAALAEEALEAHRALMTAYERLRGAVRDHRAAAEAFSHLGILATGRAPTDLPKAAPTPSTIRGQASDIAPPIPSHALTEAVVDAVRPTQPRLADQLARRLAEKHRRDDWLARKQAREQERDADRPPAAA